MARKRRRHTGSFVPPLHLVMIASATLLIIVFGIAYAFVPTSKEALFSTAVTLLIGFLTGKLTNSFGKPVIPPTVEVPDASEDDSDTEGQ